MSRPGRSLQPGMLLPALMLHAASWFTMLAHGTSWTGAWRNAVDDVAGTIVITGPLLAGLVANAYARRAETSLPLLTVASAYPARAWYRPLVGFGALAVANLVGVLLEAAVLVTAAGTPLLARPLVLLPVCVLVLVAHALVGMVVGLRLRPQLAGAVAGAVSFGLFLLAVAHLAPAAFVIGGASGDLVGTAYRLEVVVRLGLIALATSAALIMATAWNSRWSRVRAGSALLTTAVAMALGSGGVVDVDQRFGSVPVALRCRGAAPEVCIPAEAPRALPAASRRMHQLIVPLDRARVVLPDRWTYFWGQDLGPRGGMLTMRSGAVLSDQVWDEDLTWSLTTPSPCSGYFDDAEPERSFHARLLLQHWLMFRNGLGAGSSQAPRAWFSSGDSEAWVRTTYAQLRRCDLDTIRFPSP